MSKFIIIYFILFALVSYSQTNYYPITNKGKWGWVNSEGKIIQEPKYEYISLFKEGVAVCKEGNKYGLIGGGTEKITAVKYSDVINFNKSGQSLYLVSSQNKQGILNKHGIEVVPLKYKSIDCRSNVFIGGQDNKSYDIWSLGGEVVFSRVADSIKQIGHNFFLSYEEGKNVLLDNKGNELFKYNGFRVERKSRGNLLILDQNKMVFFNIFFEKIIDTNLVFLGQNKNIYEFQDLTNNKLSFSFVLNRFFKNANILNIEQYGKYYIINSNNNIGVVDTNNTQVVPFRYKLIKRLGDYYYAKTKTNKVALFSSDFKMIIPPKYNNVSVTKFGFVYRLNRKVGVLNHKGAKITEAEFKYINVNSIPVKCYRPERGMTQLVFDDNWIYKSKKEFKNYISLSSRVENKFNDLTITEIGEEKNNALISRKRENYGWFSDSVEVIKKDSTRVKVQKWGLKNEKGLVITNPVFKDFTIVNDSISYGYRGKKLKGESKKRVKDIPVLSSFTVVNHITGQILRKQSFYSLNFSEMKGNNLIRGLNRNGVCLFDKDFNLVEKEVHYASSPKDNMLLYSIIDSDKKAPILNSKMVKKIDVWTNLGRGVDLERYKSELYNPNVDYDENTYFKEYLTKRISFGFYNALTSEKSFVPQFDYATDFNNGVAFVGLQKSDKAAVKYGVINKEKIIAPLIYSKVDYFQPIIYDSLYILTLNNERALFIDSLLNIKETGLAYLNRLEKNVVIAKKKNQYGILDDNLNWVMEPSYRRVIISENNELISKEKLHGVISKEGVSLAPPIFKKKFIVPLKKGTLFFQNKAKTGKVGYYNYEYGELFKPFKGRVYESNWFILKVQSNEAIYYKRGELLKTNKLLSYSIIAENDKFIVSRKGRNIKITNKETSEIIKKKDLIVVDVAKEGIYYYENESKGLLSYKGDTLIKALKYLDLARIEDSLILSSRKSVKGRTYKYGLLNLEGKLVQPCNYNKIEKVFNDIYFCYRKVGLSLFISSSGDTIKIEECHNFESTSEGLMIYSSNKGTFFLDSSLSKVFKYNFINAKPFVKGIATVMIDQGWQILNRSGNLISIPSFQSMEPIAKNTVLAIEKPKKGICNYKGDVVIPVEFEEINAISSTVIQVIKEGKVGYISIKGKWLYNPF